MSEVLERRIGEKFISIIAGHETEPLSAQMCFMDEDEQLSLLRVMVGEDVITPREATMLWKDWLQN